ncbi:hypothetical protein CHUAL_007833 [Chamberlinius hualienensis]
MDDKAAFMRVNYTTLLTKGIWSVYCSQMFTDAVFKCNGVDISVHKIILGIMVPDILKLFDESSTCTLDIDESIMKYLLEYIYKGHTIVSLNEINDLLIGAAKLGVKSLVDGINSYVGGLNTDLEASSKDVSAVDESLLITLNESDENWPNADKQILYLAENEMMEEPGMGNLEEALENADETTQQCETSNQSNKIGKLLHCVTVKCDHCEFETSNKDAYARHQISEHDADPEKFEPKKYSCYKCDFVSTDRRLLDSHRQKEHGAHKRTFKCQSCEFIADSYFLLGRHIQNNHSEDRPYNCSKCDYKSRTSGDLRKHMVWHVDEKIDCNICGKRLRNRLTFKSHMKLHCGQRRPHGKRRHCCTLCTYTCCRRIILVNHLKAVHNVDYVQPLSKSTLQNRLASGELQCSHCEYKTKTRSLFFNHLAMKHNVDEEGNSAKAKFHCKSCDFHALSYIQLVNHVQFKHPKTIYRCEQCSFTTGYKVTFKNHIQHKHSSDKPYSCETCGVRCKSLANLRRHVLIHSGEKFQCPLCSKVYSQKIYLQKHVRVMHSADGPSIMCSKCPFKTRTNNSLKQHIKRMHNENKSGDNVCKAVLQDVHNDS